MVMTDGRPPRRPRARAAASPALVRSRTRSRSNSAKAANTWKTSLPPGVVVSICSCRLQNLMDGSVVRAHQHAAGARHAPAGEDLKRGSHTRRMRHWEQAAAG
jgi:hypothetical protein